MGLEEGSREEYELLHEENGDNSEPDRFRLIAILDAV